MPSSKGQSESSKKGSNGESASAQASEPPITVKGGSVTIDFPDSFKEGRGARGKKKFKLRDKSLKSVQVNDDPPICLNEGDEIKIYYG